MEETVVISHSNRTHGIRVHIQDERMERQRLKKGYKKWALVDRKREKSPEKSTQLKRQLTFCRMKGHEKFLHTYICSDVYMYIFIHIA